MVEMENFGLFLIASRTISQRTAGAVTLSAADQNIRIKELLGQPERNRGSHSRTDPFTGRSGDWQKDYTVPRIQKEAGHSTAKIKRNFCSVRYV